LEINEKKREKRSRKKSGQTKGPPAENWPKLESVRVGEMLPKHAVGRPLKRGGGKIGRTGLEKNQVAKGDLQPEGGGEVDRKGEIKGLLEKVMGKPWASYLEATTKKKIKKSEGGQVDKRTWSVEKKS